MGTGQLRALDAQISSLRKSAVARNVAGRQLYSSNGEHRREQLEQKVQGLEARLEKKLQHLSKLEAVLQSPSGTGANCWAARIATLTGALERESERVQELRQRESQMEGEL